MEVKMTVSLIKRYNLPGTGEEICEDLQFPDVVVENIVSFIDDFDTLLYLRTRYKTLRYAVDKYIPSYVRLRTRKEVNSKDIRKYICLFMDNDRLDFIKDGKWENDPTHMMNTITISFH